jgi:2-iminobutanoate/2-iminopropanoate deaminase
MTIKRTDASAGAGLPSGFPFTLASAFNGIVYISGMPSLGADGKFAPGTFAEEAERAWASVLAIAAASGSGPGGLLFVQVLLADIGDYAELNQWWQAQFPEPARAPARLTFQAGALPFGAKVEFQAVAATPEPDR